MAETAGIAVGDEVERIRPYHEPYDPSLDPAAPPKIVADVALRRSNVTLGSSQLPPYSLPVHPSQIYAAINAALLCLLIWCLQPWPRRDGIAFLVAILLYSVSRFLIEGIRSDEGGQLGTSLSIAQWISLVGGCVSVLLMLLVLRLPPGERGLGRKPSIFNE